MQSWIALLTGTLVALTLLRVDAAGTPPLAKAKDQNKTPIIANPLKAQNVTKEENDRGGRKPPSVAQVALNVVDAVFGSGRYHHRHGCLCTGYGRCRRETGH